jgi:acyl CoA:acetate/3-ketoacid CoA transferase alpha subunit
VDGLGSVCAEKRQVRKMVSTYAWAKINCSSSWHQRRVALELNPQGTFAERIRRSGAGIPAFTLTGSGTMVAEGRRTSSTAGNL